MNFLTLNDLLLKVLEYNPEEVQYIKRAYDYAEYLHRGQLRKSGEPYIIHPLNVAYILAEEHADRNTVCAGLLHDTLEDTKITKEEIAQNFNPDIANLVDGVTKISKMNFSTKQAQNDANTRKIITSVRNDVRIMIIKLADRLHNMRTMQFQAEEKQKENALETLEVYVPFAYYLGSYKIKSELEDLALRYYNPEAYKENEEIRYKIEEENQPLLEEMKHKIDCFLTYKEIPHEIKIRIKNIYGIYKKTLEKKDISDIHDLLALKIMVNEIDECYRTLGIVHEEYRPINAKFKDYICNPKTNMYRSLHTTVFAPNNMLVQNQIRTFDMDRVASFGLTAYWDTKKGQARDIMQSELRNKFQFFQSLTEIDEMFLDNKEFVQKIKEELFTDKVYIYTPKGDIIELPKGSTPIDLAYKIHTDIGNSMIGALINYKTQSIDYLLKTKDRVKILTSPSSEGPKEDWLEKAHTSLAKRKIKEFYRKTTI